MKRDSCPSRAASFIIRPARESDAAACLEIYAPFVRDTATSFEQGVPSLEEYQGRIRETLRRTPWLVAEQEGQVAGFAYAGRHRERAAYQWSVEVTVYLAPQFQRQGLGRRLYAPLFHCLRAQGFCNAFAVITLPNPASVALHEKLGFLPVGMFEKAGFKLGRWHDVGWWRLPLREAPDDPEAPRPLEDLLRKRSWEELLAET